MQVRKYKLTIECEDHLQRMEISGIYLSAKVATDIFMFLMELWDKQASYSEEGK